MVVHPVRKARGDASQGSHARDRGNTFKNGRSCTGLGSHDCEAMAGRPEYYLVSITVGGFVRG
jgi:hypothetical protein